MTDNPLRFLDDSELQVLALVHAFEVKHKRPMPLMLLQSALGRSYRQGLKWGYDFYNTSMKANSLVEKLIKLGMLDKNPKRLSLTEEALDDLPIYAARLAELEPLIIPLL